MIEFEEAGFSYGRTAVLRDMTLTLAPGSFHFLIGPSGAGKTTLLAAVLHAIWSRPTGRIRFFGHAIAPRNRECDCRPAPRGRRRAPGLPLPRPPERSSRTSRCRSGSAASGRRTRAGDLEALLEWVDLADRVAARPAELSGGERQRAALARAVILSPEVILADEPTGNIDWEMALRLLALLVELNRMGKTVLIATHDLEPDPRRQGRGCRRGCCASPRAGWSWPEPSCESAGRCSATSAAPTAPTGWCRAARTRRSRSASSRR